MKKVFLTVFFALSSVILLSASPFGAINYEDDFGCASDCVQTARSMVFEAANENGDHPNDDPIYMDAYMFLYTNCYYSNCVN